MGLCCNGSFVLETLYAEADDWILTTGFWDDTGVWQDDDFWND